MSVRMRHTKGHTRNRRSHHGLSSPRLSRDNKTGVLHMRHRVCLKTGMYRGKQILDLSKSLEKKEKKLKKKDKKEKKPD